jgi:uncharacterized protein YdiU (UPF0061 family)
MSGVREHFADERIKSNEAETARAIADSDIAKASAETAKANAATANERAALLEKDAAQLRLALEAAKEETQRISQGVSSRHVLPAQRALIASTLSGKHFGMAVSNLGRRRAGSEHISRRISVGVCSGWCGSGDRK